MVIKKRSIRSTKSGWKKLVKQCFERDAHKCQICKRPGALHPHHIIPKSRLRVDHVDNLVSLCPECHRGVHDHLDGWPSVDEMIEEYWWRVGKFTQNGGN
jgi:5-methylcytosine-specific restriction endonuclease McrA